MRRLLTMLAALGFAASAQAQGLRIGMRDDPDILDPTLSRTYVGTLVMTAMCDKLFDLDAKQAIVPVLATSYEWVDGVALLIRLRPGVQFHNGEPFDAAAVKYTLDRHATLAGSFRRCCRPVCALPKLRLATQSRLISTCLHGSFRFLERVTDVTLTSALRLEVCGEGTIPLRLCVWSRCRL